MFNTIFGTDGIRSEVGKSPFNENDLQILANALSNWVIKKYGRNSKVLIGHDSRKSSYWIKNYLSSYFLKSSINVYYTNILPTPALYYMTYKKDLFNCAIIISASHNPWHDNGIKIIDSNEGKISKTDEDLINYYFNNSKNIDVNYNNLGKEYYYTQAAEQYLQNFNLFFRKDFLKNIKVVLDCANGAMSCIAPQVFRTFGATVLEINCNPDGQNINKQCGSTNPVDLQKTVLSQNADCGFAFDGDGDRVIFVNKDGNIKDGDDFLGILLKHPKYKDEKNIIGTIAANKGLEEFLKKINKVFVRTDVGDKHVTKSMIECMSIIGGEHNGHIILKDYLPTSDGLFVALRLLEVIILNKDYKLEIVNKFPNIAVNLKLSTKFNLEEEPFKSIINTFKEKTKSGRLLVRFSGTEPLLRILIEMPEIQTAKTIINDLVKELTNNLHINNKGQINEKII